MRKKRYALVGTGSRAGIYIDAIASTYRDRAELVAFCDSNPRRMEYYNNMFLQEECGGYPLVPMYTPARFDAMIAESKPDTVIIVSIDRNHHFYGCRAMELGCDVISEKPMTIDAEKCQQIIDMHRKTGRKYTVTFNYRYSPRNARVKELLQNGICGEITTVHFEWLLDTRHGADYFRRWHRDKRNSGGLLIHKATHHFDLMSWWLDSIPVEVYARGDLRFYGRANAESRGIIEFYDRVRDNPVAARDPFALRITPEDKSLYNLYYQAEEVDGYHRDQSVFGDGISIEDNMSVLVTYGNRAVMTYCLCAHTPWEGYRVVFNGTRGRLEFNVVERGLVQPDEDIAIPGVRTGATDQKREKLLPEIIFQPMWGGIEEFEYPQEDLKSSHGGGDSRLLQDIFVGVKDDPLGRAADFRDGTQSLLTGIGANQSLLSGLPVRVQELIRLDEI